MHAFIKNHDSKIRIALALCALVIGILSVTYFAHRYAVKGTPSFRREYDLVLQSYDGKDVKLASFKNKILIVTAWASWCPYCKAEIENLSAAALSHGDDIHIVAVNRAEPLGDARTFSNTVNVSPMVQFLLDPTDSFYKELGGYAMPETLFIDPYGHVLFHQRGPMTTAEVEQKITDLLK